MNQVNFISYEPVDNQKFEGIATVEFTGTILLRYKMTPTRTGTVFPAAASIMIGGPGGDKTQDKFYKAFEIDSSKANRALEESVVEGIKKHKSGRTTHSQIINYTAPQAEYKQDDALPF